MSDERPAEELEEELEEKQERIEELESLVKRIKADFENYKKKNRNLEDKFKRKGKEELLKEFFDPIDGLRAALDLEDPEKVEDDKVLKGLYEGMENVFGEIESIFEDQEIRVIEPEEKDEFNHELHEAVSIEGSDESMEGKISKLLQVGYMYNGKVLRPARVSVYKDGE